MVLATNTWRHSTEYTSEFIVENWHCGEMGEVGLAAICLDMPTSIVLAILK